ncbi:hypothetical protein LUZ60_003702 [Juncus effusus]|nr:hypothetical protein LUZ60_003702 [Juncus effusus]
MDLDLFGESDQEEEEEQEQQVEENHGGADSSGGSSSPSSSSSSSSSSAHSSRSSSSAAGGGRGGAGGGGGAEEEYEYDSVDRTVATVEEEEVEDEDKDLFGSDNEEYQNTPAKSPFFIPVLPAIQSNNNNNSRPNRGGFGGRARGGILPRPGYPPRGGGNFGNFGGRFGNGARNDERFVSELRLNKSEETLSRKPVAVQEPREIASYSRVEGGEVHFDDRCLRLFKRSIRDHIGADLNKGFESFVEKRDLGSEGFGDLLACVRNAMVPLDNIHFVTYRNNLNKIMATHYIRNEPWKMGVHKRNRVVYLDVHKLPERPQSELDKRRCYWGYSFENLATENSSDLEEDGKGIDANVEFCSVIKTKLGAHRIIMGAEMDCCDSTDSGRRFYIELKTSRELEYHTEEKYEREKLLKFWIQSFLAGVPYIVVGYRNDAGVLVRTERLTAKDITQRVKMKNYWQGGVCLAFTDEVLCWLYGTVKDDEDYILQFMPPFQRLELLKAESCPDAISQHVELLKSN